MGVKDRIKEIMLALGIASSPGVANAEFNIFNPATWGGYKPGSIANQTFGVDSSSVSDTATVASGKTPGEKPGSFFVDQINKINKEMEELRKEWEKKVAEIEKKQTEEEKNKGQPEVKEIKKADMSMVNAKISALMITVPPKVLNIVLPAWSLSPATKNSLQFRYGTGLTDYQYKQLLFWDEYNYAIKKAEKICAQLGILYNERDATEFAIAYATLATLGYGIGRPNMNTAVDIATATMQANVDRSEWSLLLVLQYLPHGISVRSTYVSLDYPKGVIAEVWKVYGRTYIDYGSGVSPGQAEKPSPTQSTQTGLPTKQPQSGQQPSTQPSTQEEQVSEQARVSAALKRIDDLTTRYPNNKELEKLKILVLAYAATTNKTEKSEYLEEIGQLELHIIARLGENPYTYSLLTGGKKYEAPGKVLGEGQKVIEVVNLWIQNLEADKKAQDKLINYGEMLASINTDVSIDLTLKYAMDAGLILYGYSGVGNVYTAFLTPESKEALKKNGYKDKDIQNIEKKLKEIAENPEKRNKASKELDGKVKNALVNAGLYTIQQAALVYEKWKEGEKEVSKLISEYKRKLSEWSKEKDPILADLYRLRELVEKYNEKKDPSLLEEIGRVEYNIRTRGGPFATPSLYEQLGGKEHKDVPSAEEVLEEVGSPEWREGMPLPGVPGSQDMPQPPGYQQPGSVGEFEIGVGAGEVTPESVGGMVFQPSGYDFPMTVNAYLETLPVQEHTAYDEQGIEYKATVLTPEEKAKVLKKLAEGINAGKIKRIDEKTIKEAVKEATGLDTSMKNGELQDWKTAFRGGKPARGWLCDGTPKATRRA